MRGKVRPYNGCVGSVTSTVSVGDAIRLRGVFCCDCPPTPHPIRQPRGHRRRPRLPALDGTCARHRLQLWQSQAHAGGGQHEVVLGVEERPLLTQPRFVFAQRVDPPTDRCDLLAQVESQAFDKSGTLNL